MKIIKVNARLIPVFRDAGFDLGNADETRKAFESEQQHPHFPAKFIYSRYRNPTVTAVEESLAEIEGSAWSLLTQSGMSAIDTALSVFQASGNLKPWLFFSEIYGGTNTFIDKVLTGRRGVNIQRFKPSAARYDPERFRETVNTLKPAVVYFEAVSNPMLIVVPAGEIIAAAKENGARVIIDNTFATPYLWKPLDDGADLVIHSGTKYLSGHGNLSAGVISGNDETLLKELLEYRKLVGHMISPDDASRLGSFLKTFSLRMERHCTNASELARLLHTHPAVEKVLYPGLPDHPSYTEAKALFDDQGWGGIVTFDLAGKDLREKALHRDRFIQNLEKHIHLVPTLGDADTILLPIEPVWGDKYHEPGMIRLSAGLEPTDDLTGIINRALEKI
ncbi:MAG: PLP-dependent transferase [Chlorobi bacterium]|nr:PLP-dependent transferase [Chlorobiota bacterium]